MPSQPPKKGSFGSWVRKLQKKSALKFIIEKLILLALVNLTTIFCPRLKALKFSINRHDKIRVCPKMGDPFLEGSLTKPCCSSNKNRWMYKKHFHGNFIFLHTKSVHSLLFQHTTLYIKNIPNLSQHHAQTAHD